MELQEKLKELGFEINLDTLNAINKRIYKDINDNELLDFLQSMDLYNIRIFDKWTGIDEFDHQFDYNITTALKLLVCNNWEVFKKILKWNDYSTYEEISIRHGLAKLLKFHYSTNETIPTKIQTTGELTKMLNKIKKRLLNPASMEVGLYNIIFGMMCISERYKDTRIESFALSEYTHNARGMVVDNDC